LDISTTVKGGSSVADSITTIISDAASSTAGNNPTLTGIEELTVKSTNADVDAVINLGNATGLAKVTADFINAANADQIEIDSLAAGVPVYVKATGTLDILDVGLASTSGGDDALTVVLQTNTTSLDLDAAGIESLSITAAGAGGTVNLAGVSPTTGSATTVTLSGASAFTLKSLNTGITNVNGSALGGALKIEKGDRDADAITISGGVANDEIAMENVADVLSGGTQAVGGADKLVVNYAAVLAGITVDLSAADQVVSMDGSPNAAIQSGFEDIDLSSFSGFGAVVTGSDGANVITGTAGTDRINAGKGNDNVVSSAGNDQVSGGAGNDTFTFTGALLKANDSTTATYDGGTGANNITISDAVTTLVDGDFRGITNVGTLNLANGTNSITLGTLATDTAGISSIKGGTGGDTINTGVGSHSVETGTGTDDIVVTSSVAAAVDADANIKFTTVTDWAANDTLTFTVGGTNVFTTAAVNVTAATTLKAALDIAVSAAGNTNNQINWFLYDSATWIVNHVGTGTDLDALDQVVKLVGTFDLSNETFAEGGAGASTLTFA